MLIGGRVYVDLVVVLFKNVLLKVGSGTTNNITRLQSVCLARSSVSRPIIGGLCRVVRLPGRRKLATGGHNVSAARPPNSAADIWRALQRRRKLLRQGRRSGPGPAAALLGFARGRSQLHRAQKRPGHPPSLLKLLLFGGAGGDDGGRGGLNGARGLGRGGGCRRRRGKAAPTAATAAVQRPDGQRRRGRRREVSAAAAAAATAARTATAGSAPAGVVLGFGGCAPASRTVSGFDGSRGRSGSGSGSGSSSGTGTNVSRLALGSALR